MLKFCVQATCLKTKMADGLSRFFDAEDGATAIEYGLIAALISVVVIGALSTIGTNLGTKFTAVSTGLN